MIEYSDEVGPYRYRQPQCIEKRHYSKPFHAYQLNSSDCERRTGEVHHLHRQLTQKSVS